jgi:mannose-6-phosphate isomerase
LSEASITRAERKEKPWGFEVIFANGDDGYVGKILTVYEGQSLSLQYHERKTETIYVTLGAVDVEFGPDLNNLEKRVLGPGNSIHLPAGVVHRIYGVTYAVLVEASTAGIGWREDIVRLEDSYGRAGTTAA